MVGMSLVLGLGLVACSAPETEPVPERKTTEDTVDTNVDVLIDYLYTPTGKRITDYKSNDDYRIFVDDVLSYCDGYDLIDVNDGHSAHSSSITRTPNHSACQDGRLEPEDFTLDDPQS
jgi:hypothetical protein